jgi:acyl carrier protein
LDQRLYGKDGALDSLGVVNLIVAVEEAVEDELGELITLADERAMSQKRSPFRSIETLVDYIAILVDEGEADA